MRLSFYLSLKYLCKRSGTGCWRRLLGEEKSHRSSSSGIALENGWGRLSRLGNKLLTLPTCFFLAEVQNCIFCVYFPTWGHLQACCRSRHHAPNDVLKRRSELCSEIINAKCGPLFEFYAFIRVGEIATIFDSVVPSSVGTRALHFISVI